ncbi:MAG: DNA ligase D [Acetobacterales bacterium]
MAGARSTLPKFQPPALATLVDEPPRDSGWLHEIKYDGYRIQAAIAGNRVRLYTRSGKDWSDRFAGIAEALTGFSGCSASIDGEVVSLDAQGRSDFGALQQAIRNGGPMVYYAFDLLSLDGRSLLGSPLVERKRRLRALLEKAPHAIRYSDHVKGRSAAMYAKACSLKLEGIVSKRAEASYRSGRHREWLKVKCSNREEVVIGGWRRSSRKGRAFASLLAGTFGDGGFVYRGRIGTGYSEEDQREIAARLEPLTRKTSPFGETPDEARRGAQWVTPRLVAEVSYTERTAAGIMRHPVFLGLREDKPAGEVSAKPQPVGSATRPRLSHADKMLFPEAGLTKQALADYLAEMADAMLPHIRGRPVSLLRCTGGRDGECFFQRHHAQGMPPGIHAVDLTEKSQKRASYLCIDGADGLAAAAQIAAIELHIWGSRVDDVEHPDRLVFDLDPDTSVSFDEVCEAAREVRNLLDSMRLAAFPLLTGGKGIHVVAPLLPERPWPEVKAFARGLAHALAQARPERYVAKATKQARSGRIFIDWLRNQRGATAIAPFSPRARPGAPVAVPVRWSELARIESAGDYTMRTVPRRVGALKTDPWEGYPNAAGGIPEKAFKLLTDDA